MYTWPSLLCKYCQANFACQGGTHATPRGDTPGETMDDVQNSFHNPGASNSSTSFAALHHFGIPLTGEVGLYSLCWSQSWNRSKDQSEVFLVFAGNLVHWSVRSSSDTIGFTVFMEDVNRKVAANFFLVIPPPEVAVHFSFLHELLPGYPSSGGGGPSRSPFHAHAHLSLPVASFFEAEFPFLFLY